MSSLVQWLDTAGGVWAFLGVFALASAIMIWRLEAMTSRGMEGTVLGTLIMPYCSGIGNLMFAYLIGSGRGPAAEVITNALVNNVTNLTLLIGLPTVIWGLNVLPQAAAKGKKASGGGKGGGKGGKAHEVNRLSLLLTLVAVLFFAGATWALARDRKIDFSDGLVLVGLFLFWQTFHVFDVLKRNVGQSKSWSWMLPIDLALLGVGAVAVWFSTDWLVGWVMKGRSGFFSAEHLGWLTGWLMVLPNALLAFYYARRGNPEVVYASQVGDGHICIPLCIGVTALYQPIKTPELLNTGIMVLVAASVFHILNVVVFGRLPRFSGWLLLGAYVVFLAKGLG